MKVRHIDLALPEHPEHITLLQVLEAGEIQEAAREVGQCGDLTARQAPIHEREHVGNAQVAGAIG